MKMMDEKNVIMPGKFAAACSQYAVGLPESGDGCNETMVPEDSQDPSQLYPSEADGAIAPADSNSQMTAVRATQFCSVENTLQDGGSPGASGGMGSENETTGQNISAGDGNGKRCENAPRKKREEKEKKKEKFDVQKACATLT